MINPGKLRRIALNQQGLLNIDSFGRGKSATLRAIEHIGYVQIDTISVVERAHHHVLWTRVSNYRPEFLSQLVKQRRLFEYWYHAAAWLPMRNFRFSLPRMAQINGDRSWFKNCDIKLTKNILRRIRDEGPLRARDFEDSRQGAKQWWDWKPAKQALEQLFMQGELMVSERQGFEKIYDLSERVLPQWVDTRCPSMHEYASYLIDTSIRAHGFATQKSMSYLLKGQALRNLIKSQLAERVDAQLLVEAALENNTIIYIDAELLETRAPRSNAVVRILSPFDNAVIQRERGRDIFEFDYQIECYVPQPKRKFGYFCLPILYRDELVGRIDCKAHRDQQCLEVISTFIDREVDDKFAAAFIRAINNFMEFNQCQKTRLNLPDWLSHSLG